MAEKLDPKQVVTFEELLRACLYEQEVLRRVLVRTSLLQSDRLLLLFSFPRPGGMTRRGV